ncbi:MAG: DinB family protein [Bacteroidia bacterium]
MANYIAEYDALIETAGEMMGFIPDSISAKKPAPGKWSPREIVGHLIDSATHNHHRIIIVLCGNGQLCELSGYNQDEWVRVNAYQNTQWRALIQFWKSYNQHLCRLIKSLPEETRQKQNIRLLYPLMDSQTLPEGGLISLDCLMEDYVIHLKHHLRQIVSFSRFSE